MRMISSKESSAVKPSSRAWRASKRRGQPATMRAMTGSGSRRMRFVTLPPATESMRKCGALQEREVTYPCKLVRWSPGKLLLGKPCPCILTTAFGRLHPAIEALAQACQPDGVAACAGARRLHLARAARRLPDRHGLGGPPSLPALPSRRPLRLVGAVGVLAGCHTGEPAPAHGRPVHLRVRPEHPLAPRGQARGAARAGRRSSLSDLHRRRIASPEIFPNVELLPHLKCSRPGWGRRGRDEAGEHGDAG